MSNGLSDHSCAIYTRRTDWVRAQPNTLRPGVAASSTGICTARLLTDVASLRRLDPTPHAGI
ncbi:MAG TPA: hypothetical protein VJ327_00880 [Patescibacteria group bacterium]|nr:hypothetical protein [Patescibacteria group bacterium]